MIISIDLHRAKALFNLMLKVSEKRLIEFPLRDFLNQYCWGSLVPAPMLNEKGIRPEGEGATVFLNDLALSVEQLDLSISCVDCGTRGIQDLADSLAKPASDTALTEIGNLVVEYGLAIITGNLVQNEIDRGLNDAATRCPHDPRFVAYDADPVSYEELNFDRAVGTDSLLFILMGVLFGLILVITIVSTAVRCIVKRRHAKWLRTLPIQSIHAIKRQQQADKQMEKVLNENTTSMLTTPELPRAVRLSIPIIIIGNIAFFISGHLSVAAEVGFSFEIAGEDFKLERLFEFTIISTTIGMWEAGAKEMAIFICIFAVIWPYTKQVASLFCWCLPPGKLSISTRGSTYLILDALAKWSIVDIFVLLITMVAFR
jgi:Paraquat-inducible protein A